MGVQRVNHERIDGKAATKRSEKKVHADATAGDNKHAGERAPRSIPAAEAVQGTEESLEELLARRKTASESKLEEVSDLICVRKEEIKGLYAEQRLLNAELGVINETLGNFVRTKQGEGHED